MKKFEMHMGMGFVYVGCGIEIVRLVDSLISEGVTVRFNDATTLNANELYVLEVHHLGLIQTKDGLRMYRKGTVSYGKRAIEIIERPYLRESDDGKTYPTILIGLIDELVEVYHIYFNSPDKDEDKLYRLAEDVTDIIESYDILEMSVEIEGYVIKCAHDLAIDERKYTSFKNLL